MLGGNSGNRFTLVIVSRRTLGKAEERMLEFSGRKNLLAQDQYVLESGGWGRKLRGEDVLLWRQPNVRHYPTRRHSCSH